MESTSSTTARRVGRPANPTDPESGHRSEILAWVSLNSRIRKVLEKQVAFFEKQLSVAADGASTLSVESMLDIMKGLGDLLKVGTSTVESGIQSLEKGKVVDEDDPETVVDSLQGGRG